MESLLAVAIPGLLLVPVLALVHHVVRMAGDRSAGFLAVISPVSAGPNIGSGGKRAIRIIIEPKKPLISWTATGWR